MKSHTRPMCLALMAGAVLTLWSPASRANDNPVILQWFETRWTDIERRMPDFFLAGYGAVWLPPPSKAWASGSAGYDPFERFDLGTPQSPTAYGTESAFRAMIDEFKRANAEVYVDAVLNHNSQRNASAGFQAAGGWPGFWMAPSNPPVDKLPTSNWGDFHNGIASGYFQSEDPNGPRYDLHRGDLVALVDIAQESNHVFIRHPVAEGNPQNIPAGTLWNRPDPINHRAYPDRDLPPMSVVNPGTARAPGVNNFTFYPFNPGEPMAGDPVADNATGLLMRWTQWMMDVHRVDGFRLDAIKHAPPWFWDTFYDSVVHNRRVLPDGRRVTAFSFGECVEGPSFTFNNYIRKDAFGNRDALDLTGSGALRDILNGGGLGNWLNVLQSHLDNGDDSDNNGSIGVNHVFSHDNGTAGDGSATPPNPTVRQMGYFTNAYVLLRTGKPKIYHNGRGVARSGGFWPRQGITTALGVDPVTNTPDASITRLVNLHNWYARGAWTVSNIDQGQANIGLSDVIIFERRQSLGGGQFSGNILVGVNDSFATGFDQRTVQTSFGANQRLLEVTGNATDPAVDPTDQIFDVVTTDAQGRATIRVPRNRTGTTDHGRGYVAYAPAVPGGTLEVTPTSGLLSADPIAAPSARRRIAAVPVITAPTFEVRLTTVNGDPGAGSNANADDNAVFRFNQGFVDLNGNGAVDIDGFNGIVPGYEQFVTQRQPLAGTNNANGLYRQTIDASLLPEGFNYLSVVAFRKRNPGESPLFREFRSVVYVDRLPPAAAFVNPPSVVTTTSRLFEGRSLDRTATRMHIILNVPPGADPLDPAYSSIPTLATRTDRLDWSRTLTGLTHGWHTATLTAFEESGRGSATVHEFFVDRCPADFNRDGFIDFFDLDAFVLCFEGGECPESRSADFNGDGFVDFFDLDAYIVAFEGGC
ncbi:MAG: hypothetical protein HRU70_04950 [Phycisphaeraceae bacterium]|nr:MAG: hypothetical protein HRU70_04950 [Phycisphaeraceae bacterium]